MFIRPRTALLAVCCALSSQAQASLGIFEHGSGIKSLGLGGVSYVAAGETTAINANPAAALGLGQRFDLGSDLFIVNARATLHGNAAGPDESYTANGRHLYPIPQGGVTLPLAEGWAAGVAAFAAGLGPDYPSSPYARFAAPDQAAAAASAQNSLKVIGLALVLAHAVLPGQTIGLGLNLHHQSINLSGATQFAGLSEAPDQVSDVGKHGGYGASLSVGWNGALTPWLDGGLAYRSRSWTQRIEEYRGLLPDHGRLDLPAIYGAALAAKPTAGWRIALEFQRYDYAGTHAFGNPIGLLFEGRALGASNGPGLGWRSQNVGKLGVSYQALPSLLLRSGCSYANQIIPRSQTLFSVVAPATPQLHVTAGLSYVFGKASELSLFGAKAFAKTVHGQNSIPAAFGGGEADVRFGNYSVGISYGRRFGQ